MVAALTPIRRAEPISAGWCGTMSKNSEAVSRHRQSKLGAGWVRIDGLMPPESAQAAREMVEQGVATSLIHAAAVALSERGGRCRKNIEEISPEGVDISR